MSKSNEQEPNPERSHDKPCDSSKAVCAEGLMMSTKTESQGMTENTALPTSVTQLGDGFENQQPSKTAFSQAALTRQKQIYGSLKALKSCSQLLAQSVTTAFLSLPLRFKITVPYLVLAVLLAGLATWVITQSFVRGLQEQFNVELVDSFETANTTVFQSESKALITERAIARTAGVTQAAAVRDIPALNTLIRPLVINAHTPLVHILNNSGELLYGLRLTPQDNVRDENADFSTWVLVRRVLAGESDDLGDKFSGIAEGPGGFALYVAGPLILDSQRVGVVLVGFPLETLLPQMIAGHSTSQITLYQPEGPAALSTFSQGVPMPALTSAGLAQVNAVEPHLLQTRQWTLDANEYTEGVGPLLVRGQPSGWAIGVTLPRALLTSSAQISPAQLALVFGLAILAIIGLGVVIAKIIANPVFELVQVSTRVAQGDLNASVQERTQDELGVLSRRFNYMVSQLRQREFMRALFGRMVSEEVREAVMQGQVHLGGELKVVSVLFTDIRNFTLFSESRSPQEVVSALNSYFSIVHGAVQEMGGMINKFGGDSAMAIFGAPVDLTPAESARRALRAALLIHIRMLEFNARRVQAGLEPSNIGIGVNTGEVITGNIGSENRFEYTVIGDTVNVAARIQSLSSQFTESNILITQETYDAFAEREQLVVVNHGAVALKGRTESVHVYGVIGMRLTQTSPNTQAESPTQSNEMPHHNALETTYLFCRGFDLPTIAATKNLTLESVQAWIKDAVSQFERSKRELGLEFNLTDIELQRLYDASYSDLPATQNLERTDSLYEHTP